VLVNEQRQTSRTDQPDQHLSCVMESQRCIEAENQFPTGAQESSIDHLIFKMCKRSAIDCRGNKSILPMSDQNRFQFHFRRAESIELRIN
jgi:hypothetical protein